MRRNNIIYILHLCIYIYIYIIPLWLRASEENIFSWQIYCSDEQAKKQMITSVILFYLGNVTYNNIGNLEP